jgi:hypothetical protein
VHLLCIVGMTHNCSARASLSVTAGLSIFPYLFDFPRPQIACMYDANKVKPAFAFGHGLSYTTFEYSDLAFDAPSLTATFAIKNTGGVYGAEIAQLYLGFPADAGEPPKVLRGFRKVAAFHNNCHCALTALRLNCRPARIASSAYP